jgi:GT2 family glycosyltransferase
MSPKVSALIVNWNTRSLTLRCLDSLDPAAGEVRHETVVVDNGSVDGSAEALRERDDITLIANAENVGYAAAVNQAYRRARGEYVLLLNSDVELAPQSLATLAGFLDDRPEAAGVAPLYRYPDGSSQPFHFRFPSFLTLLVSANPLLARLPGARSRIRAYRMLDDDFSSPRPVDQPSASCLLLRRSLLPADHVFDERFPIYFNDVQLARTFAARGLELWVTPSVTVSHAQAASTKMLGPLLKRHHLGSLIRMLEDTEPRPKVALYKLLVLVQGLLLLGLRRRNALPLRDLARTLQGDPGPLPRAPS